MTYLQPTKIRRWKLVIARPLRRKEVSQLGFLKRVGSLVAASESRGSSRFWGKGYRPGHRPAMLISPQRGKEDS